MIIPLGIYTLIFILNLIAPKYKYKKGIFIFYITSYFFWFDMYLIKDFGFNYLLIGTISSFVAAIGLPFVIFTFFRFILKPILGSSETREIVLMKSVLFAILVLMMGRLLELSVGNAFFPEFIRILMILLGGWVSFIILKSSLQKEEYHLDLFLKQDNHEIK
jgi:hypothetical protein